MAYGNAPKKSRLQKIKEILPFGKAPTEIQAQWQRLHKEAGLIPVLNQTDTETRRQELKTLLTDGEASVFDIDKQKALVKKVYALFFSAGSPWYRGLDNRELAEKVSFFLENYTQIGDLDCFTRILFEEAMMLLNLSWQTLDVTNTPMVIIESRPFLAPEGKTGPQTELDTSGLDSVQDELTRLREKVDKQ